MNNGMYGFGMPPNQATRLAPPAWTNAYPYLTAGTYNDFVVPANVYQIMVCVWGGGGSGGSGNVYASTHGRGGDGGGYAQGIVDVIPGQVLPTITVGAGGAITGSNSAQGNAGGTSSFGTLLTATGGAGGLNNSTSAGTAGTGTASATLRRTFTATGGLAGYATSVNNGQGTGGGGAGSIYGTGGNGGGLGMTVQSRGLGGGGFGGSGGFRLDLGNSATGGVSARD